MDNNNNNRGGYQSSNRGDGHGHEPFNPHPPPSTSQAYRPQYYQTSTSGQPIASGHYPQVGHGQLVYRSQIVQPPRPPPDSYEYEQQRGPQYAENYTISPQQQYAELKRTRESSSSSGGERPQPKHVRYQHGSAEYHGQSHGPHQGGQGSSFLQGNPQVPQAPVQNTDWGANTPSIGGYGAAVPPQPRSGNRSYAAEATYQPRYNPFAGHQESAPRLHGSGAGHRNDPQPHAESGAQGAGKFDEEGVPVTLPTLESMYPERDFDRQPFQIDNIMWRGDTFDVELIKRRHWTDREIRQLAVIVASFESWEEAKRLGQLLPGQRSMDAGIQKIKDLGNLGFWTRVEDQELKLMGPPPRNGWDEAGERFCRKYGRPRAEVYGRRKMFARGVGPRNLGNMPYRRKGGNPRT